MATIHFGENETKDKDPSAWKVIAIACVAGFLALGGLGVAAGAVLGLAWRVGKVVAGI